MSPTMMRQFWSLVDEARSIIPLTLDDTSLEQWLFRRLRSERSLNHQEATVFESYIHTRLPLIRDLAQSSS